MTYANLNRHSPFPGQKMLQLLRRHDVDEDAFNNPGGNFMYGAMLPPNVLSNLMEDEYHRIPVKQRLADARYAEFVVDFEPFLSWLPELRQNPCNLLQTSRRPGMFSLIHTMVNHLPFFDDSVQHNRHMSIDNHPWFQPLCKYIASDPEGIIHVEDWTKCSAGAGYSGGQSPLSLIVNSSRDTLGYKSAHARIQEPLQLWIIALLTCGIQLLAYGRYEQANYQRQAVTYDRRGCNDLWCWKEAARYTLIGITYGSRPEHWRLWWAFEYEDYAGDFWSMVEQSSTEDPDLNIPGSWVEEPKDPRTVERERLREWENEELPPLIWSEYRKIRPPV